MRPTLQFGDYLRLVETLALDPVFSRESVAAIRKRFGRWPADACSFFGFERSLTEAADVPPDFLFCSFRNEQLAAPEASQLGPWAADLSASPIDAWSIVSRFGFEWLRSDSGLQAVENIWLEFDRGDIAELPQPNLFFGPALRSAAHDMPGIIEHAIPFLRSSRNDASEADAVLAASKRFLSTLPAEALPFHCGVMLARNSPAIRLVIRDIPPPDIPNLLRQNGWKGDLATVSTLLARVDGLTDWIGLNVDLFPALGPKIGLELHLDKQAKFEPRWTALMKAVADLGAGNPAMLMSLPQLNGYLHEEKHRRIWPEALLFDSRETTTRTLSTLIFFAHHIKLVIQPDSALLPKAYEGFTHRMFDRASLTHSRKTESP